MHAVTIVRRPLITEKSTVMSTTGNRYAFEVDPRATKPQIRRAVEELYDVRVLAVATQNRKGEIRRNKHGFFQTKNMKRAIVKIHPEDRIELF